MSRFWEDIFLRFRKFFCTPPGRFYRSGQNFPDFGEKIQSREENRQESGAEQPQISRAAQKGTAGHENAQLSVAEAHAQKEQPAAGQQPEQGVGQMADAPAAAPADGPQQVVYQGEDHPGAEGDRRLVQL